MNENPEGTPNPLNPGPVNPEVESTSESIMVKQDDPAEEVVVETTSVSTAPVAEVEPKDVAAEPKKKKSGSKLGIILTIIIILICAGCAAAAILILKPFDKQDAVPAAILKLMDGAPEITVVDGSIKLETNDETSLASDLTIDFRSGLNNTSSENYVDANITAALTGGTEFSFKANEIHTKDGNLYLKLSGISTALEYLYLGSMHNTQGYVTDCETEFDSEDYECEAEDFIEYYDDDEEDGISGLLIESLGLVDVIDDNWILIPDSNFSNLTSLAVDDTTQCLVNAAGKLNQYGKDFAKMYKENQFVTYSTDNISIAKKKDTIYRLSFDAEKMADFINAMNNSGFMNELNACLGNVATNKQVTASDLGEFLTWLPEIYAEIDKDNNFTRVYLESATKNNDCDDCVYIKEPTYTKITADLSFSYPDGITIERPTDYIDFNSVILEMMKQFYGTSFDETEWIDCQPPLSEIENSICEEAEASEYPYIVY